MTETSAVPEINDEHFTGDLLTEGWALVDFYATWCSHCRAFRPNLETVAAEHQGPVRFYAANVDEAGQAAKRFTIRSIPALVLLKDGEQQAMHTGVLPPQALADWLAAQLGA